MDTYSQALYFYYKDLGPDTFEIIRDDGYSSKVPICFPPGTDLLSSFPVLVSRLFLRVNVIFPEEQAFSSRSTESSFCSPSLNFLRSWKDIVKIEHSVRLSPSFSVLLTNKWQTSVNYYLPGVPWKHIIICKKARSCMYYFDI